MTLLRTMMPRCALALSLLLLATGVGCTTSMTNLSSARTLDQGEHQITGGGQINLNSSVVTESIDAYDSIRSDIESRPEGEEISEETFRNLLDAAVATALFRPSPAPEAAYRIGVSDVPLEGVDVGARYNGQTFKAEAKLQFWESSDGIWAGSFQAGYGHQFSAAPSFAQKVTMQDWSRSDLDLLVPFGASFGEYGRVYGGPRLIWSHISAEPDFDNDIRSRLPPDIQARADSWFSDEQLLYVGGNLGGMIGYKYAYLALEFNVMYVSFTPEVLGETRDLSGVSVTPATGLVIRF